jgi:hypothetical protein
MPIAARAAYSGFTIFDRDFRTVEFHSRVPLA